MSDISFSTSTYPSSNGRDTVSYCVWKPASPRAVVQLAHGMQEYVQRYDSFARYLAKNGFVVAGNDHLGHGQTAPTDDDLGFTGEGGGADAMIADLHTLTGLLRSQFKGLPLILIGHSMGSFLARCAVADYPGAYDAAVFIGTSGPGMPTGAGKALARWRMFRRGERYRSNLIAKVAFGSYNSRYEGPVNDKSWISRDTEIVKAYIADKYCNYPFTARGFYDLFELLGRISRKDWAAKLPKAMPILLTSGEMDPVGGFGKGVREVHRRLEKAGIIDLTLKLYPGARHEILNEINRTEVYADILAWLEARIAKENPPHA